MKNLILFIYCLPFFSFAQAKQGSIVYELYYDFSNFKTDGDVPETIKQVNKEIQGVSFTLLYNQEGMIFNDNRDSKEIENAVFGLTPGNKYYFKKATNDTIYMVDLKDKSNKKQIKFLYDSDWQLSKETKKINGFVCYKATRMPSENSIDEILKDQPIIAWYTPEIPLPYGPFGYGGLPGLILELQRDINVIFKAKKMRWNEKNKIKIEFPSSF